MTEPTKPKFKFEKTSAGNYVIDVAADSLANDLERERDSRKEERFLCLVAFVVMFDAIIFAHVENWAGALVIGIIELVGLAVLARKWGVQEVAQFLAMFFQRMAEHSNPAKSKPPEQPKDKPE